MVLEQLGHYLRVLNELENDSNPLQRCLNLLGSALIRSKVDLNIIKKLQHNVRKYVEQRKGGEQIDVVKQGVFHELCNMLDSGKVPWVVPKKKKKGRTSVVVFVGSKGCGVTTTCTKYACYHQKQGYKVALVCSNTSGPGTDARDQSMKYAAEAQIPFYTSYTTSDSSKIERDGVEQFKSENYDLIIVETTQHGIADAYSDLKANVIIHVVDGSMGTSALDGLDDLFKIGFEDGFYTCAIILSKMDVNANEGGALFAAAEAKYPVIFIGTGKKMDDSEKFEAESFVERLLGIDKIQEDVQSYTC